MTLITLTEPDTVYETKVFEVHASSVKSGDVVANKVVRVVNVGTKWADIRDKSDSRILRVPRNDLVTVERQKETEESRKLTRRYYSNEAIQHELKKDPMAPVRAAQAKLNEELDEYGRADYQRYGVLMMAQSVAWVEQRWRATLEHLESSSEWEGDYVDAINAFAEELKARLLSSSNHRSLSRSSSVISNLMDDVENEAAVKFLDDMRYYR